MRKVKLQLEALAVESFETAEQGEAKGTVRAHATGGDSYYEACIDTCATCYQSCESCTCQVTVGGGPGQPCLNC